MNDNPVRLRLITHNARLVDARKENGWTQKGFAEITGLRLDRIQGIENLRRIPSENDIEEISTILGLPKDYLFPAFLIEAIQEGVFWEKVRELEEPQIVSLTEARRAGLLPEANVEDMAIEAADKALLKREMEKILLSLPKRDAQVIKLRFGIDDGYALTGVEVAKKFGVTRERIRQIEDKVLRRLRHPTRSRKLKEFLD